MNGNFSVMREKVAQFAATIKDEGLKELFLNCFFSSLDTAAETMEDGSVFLLTGDIPAMWLRDSSVQVMGYLPYANEDGDVKALVRGLLKRQFFYISLDPYANAFNRDPNGHGHTDDVTDFSSPWVWERKFEVDSLCYPLWLAQKYALATGDYSVYDEGFRKAFSRILDTFFTEQDHSRSPYVHSRPLYPEFPTLTNGGRGTPVKRTGLVWNGYRPSDDVCELGYLIPSNLFALVVFDFLLAHVQETGVGKEAERLLRLRTEIADGVAKHAVVHHPEFGDLYAYEVDGFGKYSLMDDANVPSLLSLPYLGYCAKDDPVYQNTRKFILSEHNPYYYVGKAGRGVGSPHTPDKYIWHIGVAMQLLTSDSTEERRACLRLLTQTDAGCKRMHEGFHCDDPARYTRPWFCWADTLFAIAFAEMAERGEL